METRNEDKFIRIKLLWGGLNKFFINHIKKGKKKKKEAKEGGIHSPRSNNDLYRTRQCDGPAPFDI